MASDPTVEALAERLCVAFYEDSDPIRARERWPTMSAFAQGNWRRAARAALSAPRPVPAQGDLRERVAGERREPDAVEAAALHRAFERSAPSLPPEAGELVERLRQTLATPFWVFDGDEVAADIDAAIALIASREAELAQWKCNSRENKLIAEERHHAAEAAEAELARVKREEQAAENRILSLSNAHETAYVRAEAAEARIAELVGALEPFADIADEIEDAAELVDDPDRLDFVQIGFAGMGLGDMAVEDFRRAARLLAEKQP